MRSRLNGFRAVWLMLILLPVLFLQPAGALAAAAR